MSPFFGPKWHSLRSLPFQSPKKSRFPGPNPLPLALVMDLHASKTLRTGRAVLIIGPQIASILFFMKFATNVLPVLCSNVLYGWCGKCREKHAEEYSKVVG